MGLDERVNEEWKKCPVCDKHTFLPRGNSRYECINGNCGYSEPPKSCSDIDISKIMPYIKDKERVANYLKAVAKYNREH